MMASTATARVFVVDGDPAARDELAGMIDRQADMLCCGKAGGFAAAQNRLPSLQPDLVIIELRSNPGDGIEFIKSLHAIHPKLRVLALSRADESLYAERALRAGALGYVNRAQSFEETLRAIRTVLAGEVYVRRSAIPFLLRRVIGLPAGEPPGVVNCLTDRELHVLELLGGGRGTREIARHMNLSGKTVEPTGSD
jgi:DNA-binding NarL/FixJ family response regulator